MVFKSTQQTAQNYHQTRKARGERQISFWLSAEEFALLEQARQTQGLSAKALLLRALPPPAVSQTSQPEAWQEAQLQAEAERGELFAFPGQKDFLLVQIQLDRDRLPEWHPLEIRLIKGFDTAEAAIAYFCQHPAEFPKFAQTVLMHRAGEAHLGFWPEPADWYYTAHLLFEIYPRQMNSYGDYATYEALLERGMLA